MRQSRAVLLFALALSLLPSAGWTQDKPIRAADLPLEFSGTYTWNGSPNPFTVTLQINKVEQKGGTIQFSGANTYQPGDYTMRVDGTIDVKTRRITMRESVPSQPGADTNGSFAGTLSTDLHAIEAVWTNDATGQKGDLRVRAKKMK